MKKRPALLFTAILLALLAVLIWLGWRPLLNFLGAQSEVLQGADALLSILAALGALASALFWALAGREKPPAPRADIRTQGGAYIGRDVTTGGGEFTGRDKTVQAGLGGTTAAPAMRLGALGLRETKSANKLHVVMTDGEFSDTEQAAAQAQEMRQNGIVPFGIFFGRTEGRVPMYSLNQVFGEGNWATIHSLSDLPDQVGRRIEQIYRKILATK